jgi:hypothetical protein
VSRWPLRLVRREDGGVLVQVAIALPLLIILMSFVVDIANWFVHKRHLQMQADAAALAAAGDFAYPCSDEPILTRAEQYAGDTYNAQIGGTPTGVTRLTDPAGPATGRGVYMTVNSRGWPLQVGAPHDQDTTVTESGPCDARMIDVKLTETDVPWFFRVANVDFINAHARVSLKKQNRTNRLLPIAAPDVDPKRVKVTFVDEDTGTEISSTELARVDSDEDENPNATWSNIGATAAGPVSTTINSERIGVRVALSDHEDSVACDHPLVQCVDLGSATGGISRIRGWALGTGNPVAKDVRLTTGTCEGHFSKIPANATQCTNGIEAEVDFGVAPASIGARVFASRNGSNQAEIELQYDAATGKWTSGSGTIPFPDQGPNPVTMRWEKSSELTGCKGGACKGDFGAVHSMFIGEELRSGAIQRIQINEVQDGDTTQLLPGNSFRRCTDTYTDCTKQLGITLELTGTFKDASSANDPLAEIPMRVIGGTSNNSSQSTALSCRSAADGQTDNLPADLANGCSDTYTRNTGTTCPENEAGLQALPQPWQCIALALGATPNAIANGLNKRILGDEKATDCSPGPNRWAEYWTPDSDGDGRDEFNGDLVRSNNDRRLVQMVVVPKWTLLGGSGQSTLPIKRFAYFYITGWNGEGEGFTNPCQTYTTQPDDPAPRGSIVGHFVDYIESLPSTDNDLCNLAEIQTCTTQMTI